MSPQKSKKRPMSDDHKAALAEGREQGRAVRRYLEALEATKPKPGRRRTPESIRTKLDNLESEIAASDALKRVALVQERMDLERELDLLENAPDVASLEKAFIAAAGPYGERKGISYAAWREVGVPTDVLSAAGISRGS